MEGGTGIDLFLAGPSTSISVAGAVDPDADTDDATVDAETIFRATFFFPALFCICISAFLARAHSLWNSAGSENTAAHLVASSSGTVPLASNLGGGAHAAKASRTALGRLAGSSGFSGSIARLSFSGLSTDSFLNTAAAAAANTASSDSLSTVSGAGTACFSRSRCSIALVRCSTASTASTSDSIASRAPSDTSATPLNAATMLASVGSARSVPILVPSNLCRAHERVTGGASRLATAPNAREAASNPPARRARESESSSGSSRAAKTFVV